MHLARTAVSITSCLGETGEWEVKKVGFTQIAFLQDDSNEMKAMNVKYVTFVESEYEDDYLTNDNSLSFPTEP